MAHIHEKMDFTTEVFIVHKNKVLLRRHEKFGSVWLSVGGHVELDEDPTQTAIREVKEEVGLDVVLDARDRRFTSVEENWNELIPPAALGRHRVNETHEHIVLVYFATSDSDAVVPEKPDDVWMWVTKDELAAMELLPNIRYYAEAALERLGTQ
ncbi:NUDIX domain-containing protein [Candidatus Kaiserbacteria bacterium]|nr:NUDIX domain-containing protein [Candidatus Kaiserbacteria bacterium]